MAVEVAVAKKEKTKRPRKKKQVVERGKRKEAIARASIKAGKGVVRVNGVLLGSFPNPFARQIISEPLTFVQQPFDFDVDVSVRGGGIMGQAQAIRTAIARAILAFKKGDETLKKEFADYDRFILVEDARRVEPKKFKGPKARARFTKSYR
ncbi:MAG TPA: 30S ribosomal protein S9 [Candidatus Norongarragalinales archaeon]|nr:30S ribosomal protein S9 [Candidatus Norongarragalinales archaeon]